MAGVLLFIWVYKFWSVALSYLSTWAAQASKQNSNFEVKRNTLVYISHVLVLQTLFIKVCFISVLVLVIKLCENVIHGHCLWSMASEIIVGGRSLFVTQD